MEKLWLEQNFKPLPTLEHSTFYPHIPPSKKAPNPHFFVGTPRKMKSESNVWPAPLKRFSEGSKFSLFALKRKSEAPWNKP